MTEPKKESVSMDAIVRSYQKQLSDAFHAMAFKDAYIEKLQQQLAEKEGDA